MAESSCFMKPFSPHFNYFFPNRHSNYLASIFFISPRLNHKYTCLPPVNSFACLLFISIWFSLLKFFPMTMSLFGTFLPYSSGLINDCPSLTISGLYWFQCNAEILCCFSDFQSEARWIFPWVSTLLVRKDKPCVLYLTNVSPIAFMYFKHGSQDWAFPFLTIFWPNGILSARSSV